jgi:hypothetical protein
MLKLTTVATIAASTATTASSVIRKWPRVPLGFAAVETLPVVVRGEIGVVADREGPPGDGQGAGSGTSWALSSRWVPATGSYWGGCSVTM